MASGVSIGFQVRVMEEPLISEFPLVGAVNVSKRLDTVVGSVPALNNSVIFKPSGVFVLASCSGTVPHSTVASTTPLGRVNLAFGFNIFVAMACIILLLARPPGVEVKYPSECLSYPYHKAIE